MPVIDVWINCPDADVANDIASTLITERLAACANLFSPVSSIYRWKGAIERDKEVPLLVKTRTELFGRVTERVRELHPYDTPAIVGVPVELIDRDYARWVLEETADAG